MKQRYRKLSQDLCFEAIDSFLKNGKFNRNDVLSYIEEWSGYSREEIILDEDENKSRTYRLKYEIMNELSLSLLDMVEDCVNGIDPEFDPVHEMYKPDGGTGKMRMIAYLCVRMQLLGHVIKLGLEPLLNARIMPYQYASLPGKGPCKLVRRLQRMLQRKTGTRYYCKTDCTSAYKSTMYARILSVLWREIPRGEWVLKCMETMERYAPGGHLIIGGYLDAWLFNFVISYMLRYILDVYKSRRGKSIRVIQALALYMDDGVFCGSSAKDLHEAIRLCCEWLGMRFGIKMRQTTGVIRLLSEEEEVKRRSAKNPASRGIPMIDIAGYRVARSRITLRKRNGRKVIRAMNRGWVEYSSTGTLRRQRAYTIISKNGMVRNSNSIHLIRKYGIDELLGVAKSVQRYWARIRQNKRREKIYYAAEEYRRQLSALESGDLRSGWYRAFGGPYCRRRACIG